MPIQGVHFGSAEEAINRYCVAKNVSWKTVTRELRRGDNFLYHPKRSGRISEQSKKVIFAYLFKNWPKDCSIPLVVVDFVKLMDPEEVNRLASMTKSQDGAPTSQIRRCMTCRTSFESEGAHNRMCNLCRRRGDAFGAQGLNSGSKRMIR